MENGRKTAIVTGASQGIGAGVVKAFLERGYSVVANSRNITRSGAFEPSDRLALVDGNIAEAATAARIAEAATGRFGSIDALVNNAESLGKSEFSPLWAGQNATGCREVPAALLTRELALGIEAACR